ncbi:NAD-dependent epimerase/dehydratase family protein [Bdellovibrio sp. NC01]|uniref:NAD-dependent epimerase/dehydratase family protein n=1 Tax=Bdellovibrio sp. NC01 TaxID=2220073 RepID=UPI00115B48B5|nr:NAD-dependent epimerase/dehydratase family protein [Bdellovibrio sp. NC01]QDK36224.1 dihydroflavonol 4-reductase [Bdellovibrio sp. NC01]
MKVLVTGANGFLGSWVTRALVNDGHEVYALVRANSDVSELDGVNCKFVHGDVTDILSLLEAFKGMDSVFHLAGVIAYKKSQRALMEKVNVQGTANVVEVCRELKIRRLVYLSSVVAIGGGRSSEQVLNESSEFNVHDLDLGYFETKHKAEMIVKKACDKGEIDAVILNPSTVYGPGDAKKGSRKMQVKVAQGKFKFYTSGGVNVVAVEDVVAGILSAWKNGKKGERYILAGENILIKDLFTMIAQEAGVKPPPHHLPDQVLHVVGAVGDCLETIGMKGPLSRENAWTSTMFHWFDSSKAQRELGFNPRPAKEAIHNSVQWMKDHGLLS